MSTISPDAAAEYTAHGSTFTAYVSPSRGSRELCAWSLTVPPGLTGSAHRPTRDEVMLVISGDLTITVDAHPTCAGAGDVLLVPAGSELRVDGGSARATVWVTTTPGIEALLDDGTRLAPPWAA
ncbi:MAG TPA: cupin domain-containing protein [Nocardioidaceae bacterium]|jgi:quercetin dioxygenase-like cupin family protein|nr:cupin domain-containing protein [Nocardioidaceae bacterium]